MYEDGSYDEDGVFHKDLPNNEYKPDTEGNSSYYRLWSPMWWFRNNFGNIDLDMILTDLSTMHYAYDREGNKIEADPISGMPTVRTFCTHGRMSDERPLGTSNSWNVSVVVPQTLEVYYVAAMPCQYKKLSWNYVNLKVYSDYRKAVYGY
jgi:hypothetical protein